MVNKNNLNSDATELVLIVWPVESTDFAIINRRETFLNSDSNRR
jgi:hypothetical protein